MVKVELKSQNGKMVGFTAEGHSLYAESGQDIVCSAVSALTQTALLGLIEIAHVKTDYRIDDDGYISCTVTDEDEKRRENADLILRVMHCGLCSIEMNYGKYLGISEREVTQ
ncbi:MAG: ribosomal-processing cysteine protease Prp [Clostridia bacterium]|nr:ribosomal-processing cysteine protease Prp [Clostridia bacterium]